MFAVAFGVAIGILALFGIQQEAPGIFVGGIILVAIDLGYRLKKSDSDYGTPAAGGSLFFMPAWVLGAFWIILGVVRMYENGSPV
jgi:hypothetical protein